jgi:aspartyl-tRNA(Asn)/glutamyl-tRNA(Gln) amidotransferase subunit A
MHDEIFNLSICELAQRIRGREISTVEVISACLNRIDRLQPDLNCFIAVEADEALEVARQLDQEVAKGRWRGPLHGIPLAYKDIFRRNGKSVTAGVPALKQKKTQGTATVIERLTSAGCVTMGRLNLDELAAGGTGHNQHFGRCRNPWNINHITGGSSSGSAASVAAGLVLGSLGSDTGGSIRIPAAMCGVAGLKPTYGRISRFGVLPRAWSVDSVGPLGRTVEDCAVLFSAIAGYDPRDMTTHDLPVPAFDEWSRTLDLSKCKIGFSFNDFGATLDEAVFGMMQAVLDVFTNLKVNLFEVNIPNIDMMTRLHQLIVLSEAAAIYGPDVRKHPEDFSESVRLSIESGFFLPATKYIEALALRQRLLSEFLDSVFGSAEVLLTPVCLAPVPNASEVKDADAYDVLRLMQRFSTATRYVNYLGLPALSIPCSKTLNNLPVGFQLIGKPFSESLLLKIGMCFQSISDGLSNPITSGKVQ